MTRPQRENNMKNIADNEMLYVREKAEENPKIRRFIDVYDLMNITDQVEIEGKLMQLMNTISGMGILGAIELLMYSMEYRAALMMGRKVTETMRQGHALEQANWPGNTTNIRSRL